MRFVSLVSSTIAKARRGISQGLSLGHSTDDKEDDPKALMEQLRQVMLRVNKLEAALPREATEFEVNCLDTGELIELAHSFGTTSVRWSVVGWFCVPGAQSQTLPPNLVYDPSSTPDSLFLRSYVKGRAIIRVEPAQQFVDTGFTLDLTDTQKYPRIPLGPARRRLTVVGTASTTIMTVPIPDNCVTMFMTHMIGKDQTTTSTSIRETCVCSVYRVNGGAPTNFVATALHTVVVAGMTYTFTIVGNDLVVAVQCTTAAQTVDWSFSINPLLTYLTAEPL